MVGGRNHHNSIDECDVDRCIKRGIVSEDSCIVDVEDVITIWSCDSGNKYEQFAVKLARSGSRSSDCID